MRKIIPLLVIFAITLILYFPTLQVYFSQDDFFMFKISLTDGSFGEFIKLFGIYPFEEKGIAFYRPIFREVLHNIYFNVFGLNHLLFRVLLLGLHLTNIYLTFILIKKIFHRYLLAWLVAFFFGISAAHTATLNYLAGGIESSGALTFALLTFIFYLKFLQDQKIKFYLFSLLFFALSLASHEIIIATPLVMAAYRPKNLFKLWPFFALAASLLFIDIFKIGLSPLEEQYQAVFDPKKILHSLSWYSAWAFGLPEMLIDFVLPGAKLNPNLMRYWGNYYTVIFFSAGVAFLILMSRLFFLNRKSIFAGLWFIIALLPVILLPTHKSTHYLIFALVGFLSLVMLLAINLPKKWLAVFLIMLFILQVTSIKLGEKTFWAVSRGSAAQKLLTDIKSRYPTMPKGSAIYFTNDPNYPFLTKQWGGTSKQASFILNGADALQLLYQDPTLQVFYQDLGGVPADFPPSRIFVYMASSDKLGQ